MNFVVMSLSHYSLRPHKTNSQAKKRIKAAGLPFPADNQTAEFSLHPRKSSFNLKSRRCHDDWPHESLFRILLSWNMRLNPSVQKKISHLFRIISFVYGNSSKFFSRSAPFSCFDFNSVKQMRHLFPFIRICGCCHC